MDLDKIKCLSIKYNGLASAIMCTVKISTPLALVNAGIPAAQLTTIALWDTGATNSAITFLAAKKLGLVATGKINASGLGGTIQKDRFLVDLELPNVISVPNLSVTEIDNPKDEQGNLLEPFGILIGMDIICRGDFSITHSEGVTVMSFRTPSIVTTDYVREWNARKAAEMKGRRH